jgi:hypothetical protein
LQVSGAAAASPTITIPKTGTATTAPSMCFVLITITDPPGGKTHKGAEFFAHEQARFREVGIKSF